jgi:pimeloyl-ACP methyl ester carboxylesterase
MNTTTALPAALTAIAVTLGACGGVGRDAAPDRAPAPTAPASQRPTEPADDVLEIDGVGFHLHCTGAGTTTVLLLSGWGAAGDESWSTIQPELATDARACTYDRPGTGTSDPPTTDQTFETQAADLERLLKVAGEPGPYLVVGHSFGGAEAVTFAAESSSEVTGLVLIDASPTTWPEAVCGVPDDGTDAAGSFRQLCDIMHDPSRDPERLDAIPAFERASAITSLGDLPMTVISADTRTAPGLASDQLDRLNDLWTEGVASWAALSERSAVVTVADTGHHIQLEHPDVVLREVRALLISALRGR